MNSRVHAKLVSFLEPSAALVATIPRRPVHFPHVAIEYALILKPANTRFACPREVANAHARMHHSAMRGQLRTRQKKCRASIAVVFAVTKTMVF
jgi:hypothetical protein